MPQHTQGSLRTTFRSPLLLPRALQIDLDSTEALRLLGKFFRQAEPAFCPYLRLEDFVTL